MKKDFLLAVFIIVNIMLFGCAQNPGASQLETQVKSLADEVKNLRTELDTLKKQVSWSDMLKEFEGIAYLTPGAEGYSVIKSDIGIITVKLEDVKQYANGSKVTLRFGNTTSATIDGLKARLEWGTIKDGLPVNDAAKSRDVEFVDILRAGAWTRISVVLEGVPPMELGFVRVLNIGHRGIKLMVR